MKYLFCIILQIVICSSAFCQFDVVISGLIEVPPNRPQRIDGFFEKKRETRSGTKIEYYRFSKSKIDFCYYPKQVNVNCGYFMLYGKKFALDGRFENNLGCDLDYASFELYNYILNNRNYLILNAIRYGSGTTTRFIYCNLFDVTDRKKISYHPLSSIYGSGLSFGDYNNDGKIDFLEIGYQKNAKSTDAFTLVMKTYNDEKGVFYLAENKYINFIRHYRSDDSFEIIKSDSNW